MTEAVRITGLTEVNQRLSKLDADVKKGIKAVNKEAATIVSDTAKTIVPVRKGLLQRAIRPGGTLKAGVVRAGNNKSVPYAGPVHFGVGPRAGQRGPHNIKPQPFLYEALDKRRDDVIERYEKFVGKAVDGGPV